MSKRFGRALKPGFRRGYASFVLCVEGRKISRTAHQLVCAAFNGPRPAPDMHCAHRDGDKSNNTPGNLYWATPQQNADDRERHGTTHRGPRSPGAIASLPRGERHWSKISPERVMRGQSHWRTGTVGTGAIGELNGASKLSEADVRAIIETPKTYGSGRRLARQYGVTFEYISMLRNGRAWKWLTPPLDTGPPLLPGDA